MRMKISASPTSLPYSESTSQERSTTNSHEKKDENGVELPHCITNCCKVSLKVTNSQFVI